MLQGLLGLFEVSLNRMDVMGGTQTFCNAEQEWLRGVFPHHLPQTPSCPSFPHSPPPVPANNFQFFIRQRLQVSRDLHVKCSCLSQA